MMDVVVVPHARGLRVWLFGQACVVAFGHHVCHQQLNLFLLIVRYHTIPYRWYDSTGC